MYRELINTETHEGFEIRFYAREEYANPQDCFDESIEAEFGTFEKIADGRLAWFCAEVTASKNGIELASDYLGACCYESVQDFVRESDGYYEDMRERVIEEARAAIQSLAEA